MDINTLVHVARELVTEDDSNPEYDRALVELVAWFMPGDMDSSKAYLYPVITGRSMPE